MTAADWRASRIKKKANAPSPGRPPEKRIKSERESPPAGAIPSARGDPLGDQ